MNKIFVLNDGVSTKNGTSILGSVLGVCYALFETIISNVEISFIDPSIQELIRDFSITKLLIYGVIGFCLGEPTNRAPKNRFIKVSIKPRTDVKWKCQIDK